MATKQAHAAHGDAHGHDDGAVHAHVSSFKFLVGVFSTLIFLTFVTVYVSYFDFGSANILVALVVATVKASLVSWFFMHLNHDKRFHLVIFLMSFVFLGLFLTLTMDDLSTRGHVDESNGVPVLSRNGEIAPGSMPSAASMSVYPHGGDGLAGRAPATAGAPAAAHH